MRKAPITAASVFVVSGGARGITAHCVIRLAQRYRCTFILLGRSARAVPESALVDPDADEAGLKQQLIAHLTAHGTRPTPAQVQRLVQGVQSEREISATLQAIEQAGGTAIYLSVDITNAEALQAALRPHLQQRPITGLIHGAGNLADRLIEKKTLEDFERVYSVKVQGLQNLLTCLSLSDLNYLILFTSVAGFYGNVGQSDYAIANEILNKVAHRIKRDYPSCHAVAINWGPWDGGMVTPTLKERFAQRNIQLIPVDAGADLLIYELEAPDRTDTQVVVGRPIETAHSQPDIPLRSYRQHRRLDLEANPVLHSHVIGDHVVLPAVFGIGWLANACEQTYPGYIFHKCSNYRVLKGIVFDDTFVDTYTLDLQEIRKSDTDIVFEALIWSTTPAGKQRYHYSGEVTMVRQLPAVPSYAGVDLSDDRAIPGEQIYGDGTLFHGPALQGIERVLNVDQHHLTTACRAPLVSPTRQGQFPVQTFNPYQADIQFQCLLIWVRHFYHSGSLPLRADAIIYFRSLLPGQEFFVSMDVLSSNESKMVADVHVHDRAGLLYMRVERAEVAISSRLNELFLRARARTAEQRS
jgi:NAD(P)-dependent dehydrogenase (short-subunit alcohol dehydrogenase family)